MKRLLSWIVGCLMAVATPAIAQVGIFENAADIGDSAAVGGFSDFNQEDGRFIIEVFTSDLDEVAPDNFHYVYNEMSGSFSIQADPLIFGGRGGVMIRNNNSDIAAHASLLMTPDLNIWPHLRFSVCVSLMVEERRSMATQRTIRLYRCV